jgi:hypothetical protein
VAYTADSVVDSTADSFALTMPKTAGRADQVAPEEEEGAAHMEEVEEATRVDGVPVVVGTTLGQILFPMAEVDIPASIAISHSNNNRTKETTPIRDRRTKTTTDHRVRALRNKEVARLTGCRREEKRWRY